jgi:hypothetical protein
MPVSFQAIPTRGPTRARGLFVIPALYTLPRVGEKLPALGTYPRSPMSGIEDTLSRESVKHSIKGSK